jgi:hypothetical protein
MWVAKQEQPTPTRIMKKRARDAVTKERERGAGRGTDVAGIVGAHAVRAAVVVSPVFGSDRKDNA